MPQASDEMRALMHQYFNNGGISDAEPYNFLRARGWTDQGGMLIKPTSAYTISKYEWNCVMFLCDEWDYAFDPDFIPDKIVTAVDWNNVAAGAVVYEVPPIPPQPNNEKEYSNVIINGQTFKILNYKPPANPVNLDLSALKPEHIIGDPLPEPDKFKQITDVITILKTIKTDHNERLRHHLTAAINSLEDASFFTLKR